MSSFFESIRCACDVDASELPGYKSERVVCAKCGEGVNFGRFEEVAGEPLCISCARPELCYWTT